MNSSKIDLETIGWDLFFKKEFDQYQIQGFIPGRITQIQRKNCIALTELGEIKVKISGKFRFANSEKEAFPVPGPEHQPERLLFCSLPCSLQWRV